MVFRVTASLLIMGSFAAPAWAEDSPPESPATAPAAAETPSEAPVAASAPKRAVKKKGRASPSAHKETEGTTAPNRFEADTVVKSQYRLDGQPLEVDPD